MSILSVLSKISHIITEPINVLSDWAREPLKNSAHARNLEQQNNAAKTTSEIKKSEELHAANILSKQKELDAKIEQARAKIEQENKIMDADLLSKQKQLDTELHIKKETEIPKILAEIDELRKDNEFNRMKAVSDAIMEYQKHLTKLNVEAVSAIGTMQLDLREKAQALVYDKTIKYKQLQDMAHQQAFDEITKIETTFQNNEMAKSILMRSVEVRLVNIITTAQNFLIELNNDIAVINNSITLLTEKGQGFIENHLGKFQTISNGMLESKEHNNLLT